jgi:hypothetical protein
MAALFLGPAVKLYWYVDAHRIHVHKEIIVIHFVYDIVPVHTVVTQLTVKGFFLCTRVVLFFFVSRPKHPCTIFNLYS